MRFTANLSGWIKAFGVVLVASALAACGGGGGSSSSSSGSSSSSSTTTSANPNETPTSSSASNTAAIAVNTGVANVANIPTVSVTVCAPGTSTCQTVNNVQVDTASFGLRIVNTALNSTMLSALATVTPTSGSGELVECTQFADGYTWGSVRKATVQISGETASNINMQVIGDLSSSTVPSSCSSAGTDESTASQLGANGILGIGVAPFDCGSACASSAANSNYYACPSSTSTSCTQTAVAATTAGGQVQNPVPNFSTDNNGVIVEMASVGSGGAATGSGTLVFGIGTQSNNTLSSSATRFLTSSWGDLNNSTFNSTKVAAFFDSGSNGLFLTDSALAQCGGSYVGFYCPSSTTTLNATVQGASTTSSTITFNIANAETLYNSGNYAFNDLGGTNGSSTSLDMGLPFFYGRYMYYGIDQTASGGQSPYVAF